MMHSISELLPANLEILVCQDLSDLRNSHAAAFRFFQQHHREFYSANQRIVLYSSHEPEQTFLDHIQYAAARIDVSNFFILFLSPFDLTRPLDLANQKHGYDHTRMQNLVMSLPTTNPLGPAHWADRRYLCALPFMKLDINTQGQAAPCCKFKGQVGAIGQKSIQDIFHDVPLKAVRAGMISGQQWPDCATCWKKEQQGLTSMRQLFLSKYQDQMDHCLIDQPELKDLTIGPSTLCNFKCRICDDRSSSQIQTENIMHEADPAQVQTLQERYRSFTLRQEELDWFLISKDLETVEYLHVLGGEPFLSPKVNELIDQLIASGHSTRIHLEFNTNGSIYPKKLPAWIQCFRSVAISLSIDDVGSRFEIQRGGRWPDVQKNIKSFAAARQLGACVQLSPTINLQNILYLDDLVRFAQSLDLDITWTYLEHPQELSIEQPTANLKKLVCERYQHHSEPELRSLAEKMRHTPATDGKRFLAFMRMLDSRRSQDFCSHHPELCESMIS